MSTDIKNLFSNQAKQYARFRPRYPEALLQFVAGLPDTHECAWDCATGNGQAALGLTPYFKKIIATDVSEAQIRNAKIDPKIEYSVAPAEKTLIATSSVDLVTVAQAVHWFDLDVFYEEVKRVLKPGGWLALWAYGHNRKMTPEIDRILEYFSSVTVGKYWSERIRLIHDKYKTIPFPFNEISSTRIPQFTIEQSFSLDELIGYLSSWSSTQDYISHEGRNPLPEVREKLARVWGDPKKAYPMTWMIYFRIGQKHLQ